MRVGRGAIPSGGDFIGEPGSRESHCNRRFLLAVQRACSTKERFDAPTRRFLVMLALLVTFVLAFFLTPIHEFFDQENAVIWRAWIADTGVFAPFLFLLVLVSTALCGIPRMYPTILGAALFGIPLAMILSVVGSSLGAAAAFLFARVMGRDFVANRLGPRARSFDDLAMKHGFTAVALLRLIPFSNFVVTNYLCGVSSVRFADYLGATALGMIPSTLFFVLLGQGLVDQNLWLIIASTVALVAFTAFGLFYLRRFIAPTLQQEKR